MRDLAARLTEYDWADIVAALNDLPMPGVVVGIEKDQSTECPDCHEQVTVIVESQVVERAELDYSNRQEILPVLERLVEILDRRRQVAA